MNPNLWHLLRRLARGPDSADGAEPVPDAELLTRFARDRDQAAFELLVWRHGPMVLGACRRILRDAHAADDAFQAAFLILARKAGSVRAGGSVGPWLHRVARRVAIRAAKRTTARHRHEQPLTTDPLGRPEAAADPELRAVLDAEIDRLPDRFRLPVVLCYLDGRSTEDAARLLGVPRGTVLSRLAIARRRLADRLTRRGITAPAAGLFAVGWSAGEAVSTDAVVGCVSAAVRYATGAAGLSGEPVQLAEGVLRMATRKTVTAWAAVLLATAGLGTGIGVVTAQQGRDGPRAVAQTKEPDKAPQGKPTASQAAATDAREQEQTRSKKLQQVVNQLSVRIEEKEMQLRAWVRPLGVTPELATDELTRLRDEMARLQSEMSKARQATLPFERQHEAAIRELFAAERATVPEVVVQEAVDHHPEVIWLTQAIAGKTNEIAKATKTTKAEELAALNQQRANLQKQLRDVKELVRPEITVYLRSHQVVAAKQKVEEALSKIGDAEKSTRETAIRYDQARRDYQLLSDKLESIRSAQEELQTLRELRNQLRRELITAEYNPNRTAAESDPKLEQVLAELREIKRELKRLNDVKK